jgi:hypothetical protein
MLDDVLLRGVGKPWYERIKGYYHDIACKSDVRGLPMEVLLLIHRWRVLMDAVLRLTVHLGMIHEGQYHIHERVQHDAEEPFRFAPLQNEMR